MNTKKLENIKLHLFSSFTIASFVSILIFKYNLIVNITPSMPKGVYYSIDKIPAKKDVVAICLPERLRLNAKKNGYLLKGIYCYGTTPLIKQIIAVPGDAVLVTDDCITVNNKCYHIKKYSNDCKGRRLYPYPSGNYQAHGYWILGTSHNRSWDSRYFGEVNKEAILSVLKPLIIW